MEKKDTMYTCIILTNIKVVCSLYKLAHVHLIICNATSFCYWKVHNSLGLVQICTCGE
jgi:hypothetical protein